MSSFEQNFNTPPAPKDNNEAMKEQRQEVIRGTIVEMLLIESYSHLHQASMPEIMGFVRKNYTNERLLGYVDEIIKELGRTKPSLLEGLDNEEINALVVSTINNNWASIGHNVMNKANTDRNKRNGIE